MTRKSTTPAVVLALVIAGLTVWQCGCIRTQPASTQADEESRDDPAAKSPNKLFAKSPGDPPAELSGDPFAEPPGDPPTELSGDPFAEPPDDPFADPPDDPFADPPADDSGNPFAEDAAADEPAGDDPFGDDPFGAEPADVNPFAEVPDTSKQSTPRIPRPVPSLLFFAATPDGQPGTAEAAIRKALDGPISLDLVDAPLADVAATLRDKCTINVAIDCMALDRDQAASEVAITVRVADLPLRAALRQMFREQYLAWTIRDEALLITLPEEAEMNLVTQIYDVADLVTFRDEQGELWEDHLMLEDAITATVAPESWDYMGGTGYLYGITLGRAKVLVVTQTEQVHRQVAKLLENLRTAARKTPGDGRPPVKKRRPQQRSSPIPHGIPVVG